MTRCEFISKLINENNYKRVAEIGVYKGQMASEVIRNSNLNLYVLVDPEPKSEFYNFLKSSYNKINPRILFMRMFSNEAVAIIPDESLDLVFIDANHSYENVKEDIEIWKSKIRKGGILSGHDYEHRMFKGVKEAVDDSLENFNLEPDDIGENPEVKCWWIKI